MKRFALFVPLLVPHKRTANHDLMSLIDLTDCWDKKGKCQNRLVTYAFFPLPGKLCSTLLKIPETVRAMFHNINDTKS